MGANFCTMTLPGTTSKADVRLKFEQAQEQDRYENGHCYSGGFGMASGLKWFVGNGNPFGDAQSAETYLQANCVKWEEAMVVPYKNGDEIAHMIGAWCAS